jgi:hypothetical protein
MDHEKSRIKVKKMAKIFRPGATSCDLWPDSRYSKKIKSIQIYNSNLLNLLFLLMFFIFKIAIMDLEKPHQSQKNGEIFASSCKWREKETISQEWS